MTRKTYLPDLTWFQKTTLHEDWVELHIRIYPSIREKLQILAYSSNISTNRYLTELLQNHIDKENQ